MTPCFENGEINYDALVATGRQLIDQGMRGVVYCGSMGDWPLLTDEQRMKGVELLVQAGIPTVVGTGAQNGRSAAALAAHAREVGADGLMVIPRVLSRGLSPVAQRHHFSEILKAGGDLEGRWAEGDAGSWRHVPRRRHWPVAHLGRADRRADRIGC
jgi:4-hydroxy-tetrahydrodipicolinate synthase